MSLKRLNNIVDHIIGLPLSCKHSSRIYSMWALCTLAISNTSINAFISVSTKGTQTFMLSGRAAFHSVQIRLASLFVSIILTSIRCNESSKEAFLL